MPRTGFGRRRSHDWSTYLRVPRARLRGMSLAPRTLPREAQTFLTERHLATLTTIRRDGIALDDKVAGADLRPDRIGETDRFGAAVAGAGAGFATGDG